MIIRVWRGAGGPHNVPYLSPILFLTRMNPPRGAPFKPSVGLSGVVSMRRDEPLPLQRQGETVARATEQTGSPMLRFLWCEAVGHAVRKDEALKRFYRRKLAQKGFAKAKDVADASSASGCGSCCAITLDVKRTSARVYARIPSGPSVNHRPSPCSVRPR
jgi:hypothetical protein